MSTAVATLVPTTDALETLEQGYPEMRGHVVAELLGTDTREWATVKAEALELLATQYNGETEPREAVVVHCLLVAEMVEVLSEEGYEGTEPVLDLHLGDAPRPAAGSKAANQFGVFQVIPATPGQARFVKALLGEREIPSRDRAGIGAEWEALAHAQAGTLSKKAAGHLITWLLTLPIKAEIAEEYERQGVANPASDKQVHWIKVLPSEKDLAGASAKVLATIQAVEAGDPVEKRDASAALDFLFAAARKPREARTEPELESGIYAVGDKVYKVYINQEKTRMLAKVLVLGAEGEKATWSYQGMASRFVKPSQRMTLEQAKAFGAIYGVCCNCGATLTDETSIENGIGPICAKRFA